MRSFEHFAEWLALYTRQITAPLGHHPSARGPRASEQFINGVDGTG